MRHRIEIIRRTYKSAALTRDWASGEEDKSVPRLSAIP
jgi:hypothetical protein